MVSVCAWVIGVVVGFLLAVFASCRIDKSAVEQGVVKLDGKVYLLTKIE